MKRLPILIYLVIGAVNVLGHYLDQPDMVRFSKPMLMPALMFLIYDQARGAVTPRHLLLFAALFFAWLGDLALMQKGEELYFLLGLGAFLVTQVLYTVLYYRSAFERPEFRLMALLPILTFTIFFVALVVPNVPGNMQAPIVVYAVCITAMASMARLRLGLTSNNSYQWVMTGSLLFVVSDTLIALDKFRVFPLGPTFYAHTDVLIMATYIGAQLLIVRGVLDHPE